MYWAALTIGLFGGLHCSLMCSPLLAAIFKNKQLNTPFFVYQLGRLTTYIIIGSAFYFLGQGFKLLGIQQVFSLLMAAYVIYFYLLPAAWRKWRGLSLLENKPFQFFKKNFNQYFREQDNKARYFQGLLNGLLPCGLVYLAVANSLLANTYFASVMSMTIFGLATLPWLTGAFIMIKAPLPFLSKHISRLRPALVLIVVCFLILRGLGIDYLRLPMPQVLNEKAEIVIPICGKTN